MNEKLQNVQWGEYRIGDLFNSENGDFDIQKSHINDLGEYVITAGLTNDGVLGKTNVNAKIIDGNTITIDMFGNSFYRQFKYKMVTHARVFSLIPKFNMNKKQGLYIVNSFKYLMFDFGYENMCSWAKIQNNIIQLPTKDGEIDFEFMESFISELEEERISELSAYLKVSGLDNYELSKEEKEVLENFDLFINNWDSFKIQDVFDVKSSKKKFDANKIKILKHGFPYIVRMSTNNGIKGYLKEDEQFLNKGNTIAFGQDTATMFYQEKPYFTGDKIKILECKYDKFNKINSMFLISTMKKSFSTFSWGASSFSEKAINNQEIKLPTKNNEIDFSYMELLISAVQKLVIKDVVLYTDNKIESTKQIVSKN
ncbi:MAG: restriction endonuclease subunit S [Peptoniphilaceae bacterium]|nr:restriction endonuclease subunit S [Peptoniphilaceae bacterium]